MQYPGYNLFLENIFSEVISRYNNDEEVTKRKEYFGKINSVLEKTDSISEEVILNGYRTDLIINVFNAYLAKYAQSIPYDDFIKLNSLKTENIKAFIDFRVAQVSNK